MIPSPIFPPIEQKSPLTLKEYEVCRILAERTEKVAFLAGLLGIACKTFESHKYAIYRKLNVHSRIELRAQFAGGEPITFSPVDQTVVLRHLAGKIDKMEGMLMQIRNHLFLLPLPSTKEKDQLDDIKFC